MNEDQTLIDVRLAAQQELACRKNHALSLMAALSSIIILVASSLFNLVFPVAILVIMLLMFFYVQNQKQIKRLEEKYGV